MENILQAKIKKTNGFNKEEALVEDVETSSQEEILEEILEEVIFKDEFFILILYNLIFKLLENF